MITVNCPFCLRVVHTNRKRIAKSLLRHGCDTCQGDIDVWESIR